LSPLFSGGADYVYSGADATSTVVRSGSEVVYGSACGTTIGSGGYESLCVGCVRNLSIAIEGEADVGRGTAVRRT
jgi:autotransporter passenger strand-loop-strand repeat protein